MAVNVSHVEVLTDTSVNADQDIQDIDVKVSVFLLYC